MASPRLRIGAVICAALLCGARSEAVVNLSTFTYETNSPWVEVTNSSVIYDYNNDHQTGQPADDIIGVAEGGFFYAFDSGSAGDSTDGFLAFRVRLNAQNGNKDYYGGYLWVGIDANGDSNTDAYIQYNSDNSGETVQIYGPGTGANDRPSTSTVTAPNNTTNLYEFNNLGYSEYRAVSAASGDSPLGAGGTNDAGPDGNPDFYASFQIPFALLVAFLADPLNMPNGTITGVDDTTSLGFIVASSTNANSFNQDVGGINGNLDTRWIDGPISDPFVPIPEPSSSLLVMLAGFGLLLRRRRA